ncbi:MAG: CidA/LrgA family protein [Halieaceae bacterium]|nr:CidA/LrgA family protein [Halieaceae bacterium]
MKHIVQVCLIALGLITLWLAKTFGNYMVAQYAIPIPGPVLGMLIILTLLLMLGDIPRPLSEASAPLLQHMNLLFIPAAVGLMGLGSILSEHGVGIIAAMLVSTLVGFWVCVQVYLKRPTKIETKG